MLKCLKITVKQHYRTDLRIICFCLLTNLVYFKSFFFNLGTSLKYSTYKTKYIVSSRSKVPQI